jgi:predicted exporter
MLVKLYRIGALAWGLWVIFCIAHLAGVARTGITLDTSVLALLPQQDQSPLADQAAAQLTGAYRNLLVVMVAGDDTQAAQVSQVAQAYAEQLRASGTFKDVRQAYTQFSADDLTTAYKPYRFGFLDSDTRQMIKRGQFPELSRQALQTLYSPVPAPRAYSFVDDPFNLFGGWLQSLPLPAPLTTDAQGIYIRADGQFYRVVFAEFAGDAFDLALQDSAMRVIQQADKLVETAQLSSRRSGLLFHAAAGAEQAKFEMSTIGVGSLLGILLLIYVIFGRVRDWLLTITPILVGCVVALSVSLRLIDDLHVITLVFGASLIGVSVDYIFHYLCAFSSKDTAPVVTLRLLPALALGLGSSLVAYLSFLLTPFPGLQQMAIFAVIGLLSTWLTMVLWYSAINVSSGPYLQQRLDWLAALRANRSYRPRKLLWLLGGVPLLVIAMQTDVADDVRSLNTASKAAMADEQVVQQLLKTPVANRYFLVAGDDLQTLLETEERLRQQLSILADDKLLARYQAVSSFLPSLQLQQSNVSAIETLYTAELFATELPAAAPPRFWQALQLPEVVRARHQIDLDRLADERLTFEVWQDWPFNTFLQRLIVRDAVTGQLQGSMVLVSGVLDESALSTLSAMAAAEPRIEFVDTTGRINDVLGLYRQQMSLWLGVIYCVIACLLWLRFRRQALLIVAVPALATLGAIIGLMMLGQPLTLFHLLAAVLVLGIGLDMGIFLTESGAADHALLAVSASALSTMLAFGLLALSQTPVLQFFGQMVMLGITMAWLLSMTFLDNYRRGVKTDGL